MVFQVQLKPVTYSRGEEIANSVTHGLGLALSVAALSVLVTFAAMWGDAWRVTGCAIFGTSLMLLYGASTLYHAMRAPRLKQLFRALDHSAIFVLIAGTYTPFLLANLRGPWGWSLFGVVGALAIGGIVLKLFFAGRFHLFSTFAYLFMGWLILIAFKPLILTVPLGSLAMLLAGGLAYSVGTVFYLWHRPYNHAIWHLFVLAGSACHFFAVLGVVVARSA